MADKENVGLTIPWPWLAGGLATVAIGALGALAVVASENNIDTLSTVALALAVIAFAVQLIIAVAQFMGGAQQVAQVERVNANTQGALSSLRAASDALLATQREHFGQLLQAALARAIPEAVNETLAASDEDSDDQSGRIQDAITGRVHELLQTGIGPSSGARMRPPHPRLQILTTYPDEQRGRELAEIFKSLTPWEAQRLGTFTPRAVARARVGLPTRGYLGDFDPNHQGPAMRGLQAKGIMTVRQDSDGRWSLDLTDLGTEVAALIGGEGEVPTWLLDVMG